MNFSFLAYLYIFDYLITVLTTVLMAKYMNIRYNVHY